VEWAWEEYGGPLETAEEMDDALVEYGQWVFDVWGGRGKWRLNMALYGIEHLMPGFQGQLVLGRRSLRGWTNLRPPQAHPPITYGLTCVVAAELSRMGHPGAAVAALLSYDCYLRISEMSALRCRDLSRIRELTSGEGQVREWEFTGTLVSLAHTKTGNDQSVAIRRPQVEALLWDWSDYVFRQTGNVNARLFPDPRHFRDLFRKAQENLGWDVEGRGGFVPHSLRHGGASGDFLIWGGARLEEILFRGRWASVTSTRHYIQMGPALMADALRGIPEWQRELGSFMATVVRLWIAMPGDL